MALSRRALLSLFVVALAVAPRMSKATTEDAPNSGPVFKPDTANSMYDENARTNSPTRQFWDKQTRQSMDANIAIEKERRKNQGWNGEGGNVLNAMEQIKEDAKQGDHVDAGELKNEAKAALSNMLQQLKNGTNSLKELRKREAEEEKRLATTGDIAQNYLRGLENERKDLQEEREMKQRQHIEDLEKKGHFFRNHPNEGARTDAKEA